MRFEWLAALALLVCVAHVEPALAVDRIESLATWDETVASLKLVDTRLREQSESLGADARGRTAAQDCGEYLLGDADLKRLTDLHATAEQQQTGGDTRGLGKTLDAASSILMPASLKANVLISYWKSFSGLRHHELLLEGLQGALLEKPEEAKPKPLTAERTRLAAPMVAWTKKPKGVTSDAFEKQMASVFRAEATQLNARRVALMKELEAAVGLSLAVTERSGECPAPATGMSKTDKPTIAETKDLEASYPLQSKRDLVEGVVVLRLEISETGCLQQMQVYESSGAVELDRAALDVAEKRISYLPASRGGRAVSGVMLFRQRFEVKE